MGFKRDQYGGQGDALAHSGASMPLHQTARMEPVDGYRRGDIVTTMNMNVPPVRAGIDRLRAFISDAEQQQAEFEQRLHGVLTPIPPTSPNGPQCGASLAESESDVAIQLRDLAERVGRLTQVYAYMLGRLEV